MLEDNIKFFKENKVEVLDESEFQTVIDSQLMVIHK
jgi:hypothetical protein